MKKLENSNGLFQQKSNQMNLLQDYLCHNSNKTRYIQILSRMKIFEQHKSLQPNISQLCTPLLMKLGIFKQVHSHNSSFSFNSTNVWNHNQYRDQSIVQQVHKQLQKLSSTSHHPNFNRNLNSSFLSSRQNKEYSDIEKRKLSKIIIIDDYKTNYKGNKNRQDLLYIPKTTNNNNRDKDRIKRFISRSLCRSAYNTRSQSKQQSNMKYEKGENAQRAADQSKQFQRSDSFYSNYNFNNNNLDSNGNVLIELQKILSSQKNKQQKTKNSLQKQKKIDNISKGGRVCRCSKGSTIGKSRAISFGIYNNINNNKLKTTPTPTYRHQNPRNHLQKQQQQFNFSISSPSKNDQTQPQQDKSYGSNKMGQNNHKVRIHRSTDFIIQQLLLQSQAMNNLPKQQKDGMQIQIPQQSPTTSQQLPTKKQSKSGSGLDSSTATESVGTGMPMNKLKASQRHKKPVVIPDASCPIDKQHEQHTEELLIKEQIQKQQSNQINNSPNKQSFAI